jgi:hypothetical protein
MAHPDTNAALSGWAGACKSDPCTFVASADATVYAGFAVSRYTLTIAVDGPGRVQSSPAGIDCPGHCSATFDAHSLVMVHGAPASGNYFHDWGTACGDSYGADCPVFMHSDYQATATFSSIQRFFKLIVYQDGYGSGRVRSNPPGIDCTSDAASCSGNFVWGTAVTLTATAAPGSKFSGWQASCSGSNSCTVDVTSNRFVMVTFNAAPPVGGHYKVTELPPVEQVGDVVPQAMNSRGDIVGSVVIPQQYGPPQTHAFFYDASNGVAARVGDDGTFAQTATGINDARQVSIDTNGSDGDRVYRWEAGAMTQVAGPADYGMVGSSGLDARGNVYGSGAPFSHPFHAYVWDGSLHDLGANEVVPPDSTGRLYGTMMASDGTHLVEFVSGGIRDYGTPFPGFGGGRVGGGVMVGSTDADFMLATAFLYALPNGPHLAPLGFREGTLMAVNTKGDAVGTLYESWTPRHAILLQQGRLVDLTASLNDPSWDLVAATATNDRGQIAGYGNKHGHRAAFLLTPVQ